MTGYFKLIMDSRLEMNMIPSGLPDATRMNRDLQLVNDISFEFQHLDVTHTAKLINKTIQSETLDNEQLKEYLPDILENLKEAMNVIDSCDSIRRTAKNNAKVKQITFARMIPTQSDLFEVTFTTNTSSVRHKIMMHLNGDLDFDSYEDETNNRSAVIDDVGFLLSRLKYDLMAQGISMF